MKQALKSVYAKLPLKQPIFSAIRHLPVPHGIFKHLHFKGEILVPVEPGRSFRILHHGHSDENELFWVGLEGCWERTSLCLWKKLARRSEVIFDAGANHGIFSLVAKAANPSARVYSFEPVVQIFERLKRNFELNGYEIKAFPYAISDQDGETTIHVPASDHSYGASLIASHLKDCVAGTKPQRAPMRRLGTVIRDENLERLDLLKIDIELLEPQALRGLGEYLGRFRPTMLIEVLTDQIGSEIEQLLAGLGYLYYDIVDKGPPKLAQHVRKSSRMNYLLCQPAVAAGLGLELPRA